MKFFFLLRFLGCCWLLCSLFLSLRLLFCFFGSLLFSSFGLSLSLGFLFGFLGFGFCLGLFLSFLSFLIGLFSGFLFLTDLVHLPLIFFDFNRPSEVNRCLAEFQQPFVSSTRIGWNIAIIEDEAKTQTPFFISIKIETWLFCGTVNLVHSESLLIGCFSQIEEVDTYLWRHVDDADGFLGLCCCSSFEGLDWLENKRIVLGSSS